MTQDEPTEKACTKCGEVKPLDQFSRRGGKRPGYRSRCKACSREALREWRQTPGGQASIERQRPKDRQRARKWHKQNRERANADRRARYWAEPENLRRAKAARLYRKTREERLAAMRAYYRAHREEYIERARVWAEANPERRREIVSRYDTSKAGRLGKRKSANKRRARMRTVPFEDIDLQEIFERDHGICGICGEAVNENDWHLDHLVPLAHGGSHRRSNVQVAHPGCNLKKGASLPKEVV